MAAFLVPAMSELLLANDAIAGSDLSALHAGRFGSAADLHAVDTRCRWSTRRPTHGDHS